MKDFFEFAKAKAKAIKERNERAEEWKRINHPMEEAVQRASTDSLIMLLVEIKELTAQIANDIAKLSSPQDQYSFKFDPQTEEELFKGSIPKVPEQCNWHSIATDGEPERRGEYVINITLFDAGDGEILYNHHYTIAIFEPKTNSWYLSDPDHMKASTHTRKEITDWLPIPELRKEENLYTKFKELNEE